MAAPILLPAAFGAASAAFWLRCFLRYRQDAGKGCGTKQGFGLGRGGQVRHILPGAMGKAGGFLFPWCEETAGLETPAFLFPCRTGSFCRLLLLPWPVCGVRVVDCRQSPGRGTYPAGFGTGMGRRCICPHCPAGASYLYFLRLRAFFNRST